MHYLLIILLMITPMRGVLASSLSHCDMSDMDMSAMDMTDRDMINKDAAVTMMHEHHASAETVVGKLVTDEPITDKPITNKPITNKQVDTHSECCCCDGNSCTGNCDMGMSVSILMQDSRYTPVFIDTKLLILSSSSVLAVALTPPSRPPALLS